jgi:hypothetical protein
MMQRRNQRSSLGGWLLIALGAALSLASAAYLPAALGVADISGFALSGLFVLLGTGLALLALGVVLMRRHP